MKKIKKVNSILLKKLNVESSSLVKGGDPVILKNAVLKARPCWDYDTNIEEGYDIQTKVIGSK